MGDLINGRHQGHRRQKSPHQQAEHKTVPDQSLTLAPCQPSAVHTRQVSVSLTAPPAPIMTVYPYGVYRVWSGVGQGLS